MEEAKEETPRESTLGCQPQGDKLIWKRLMKKGGRGTKDCNVPKKRRDSKLQWGGSGNDDGLPEKKVEVKEQSKVSLGTDAGGFCISEKEIGCEENRNNIGDGKDIKRNQRKRRRPLEKIHRSRQPADV